MENRWASCITEREKQNFKFQLVFNSMTLFISTREKIKRHLSKQQWQNDWKLITLNSCWTIPHPAQWTKQSKNEKNIKTLQVLELQIEFLEPHPTTLYDICYFAIDFSGYFIGLAQRIIATTKKEWGKIPAI